MENKIVNISSGEFNKIDNIVNVLGKFKWDLIEKKYKENPSSVELHFERNDKYTSNEIKEKETLFFELDNELDQINDKVVKLLENEEHNISKAIIFFLFVVSSLYFFFFILIGVIFGGFDLVNIIASVLYFIINIFLMHRLYYFFFKLNISNINRLEQKRKNIKYKQLNVIEELKTIK